jgi:hypothetical protein
MLLGYGAIAEQRLLDFSTKRDGILYQRSPLAVAA